MVIHYNILIIGVCILLRVILTVNYNTFCFATIDKLFYLVASVLTVLMLYFSFIMLSILLLMLREMMSQVFPHVFALLICREYKVLFSLNFLLYNMFISFFILSVRG
jgi:hypothetical protein